MLLVPASLRAVREDLLAGLTRTEEEAAIAGGLVALADARADSRSSLSPPAVAAVRRVLDSPIPDRGPLSNHQVSRTHFVVTGGSGPVLPGHGRAADEAIEYLSQLGPDASDLIYRIARCGSMGSYSRVEARLTALGFHDPEPPAVDD
jgi:hypothetical protein